MGATSIKTIGPADWANIADMSVPNAATLGLNSVNVNVLKYRFRKCGKDYAVQESLGGLVPAAGRAAAPGFLEIIGAAAGSYFIFTPTPATGAGSHFENSEYALFAFDMELVAPNGPVLGSGGDGVDFLFQMTWNSTAHFFRGTKRNHVVSYKQQVGVFSRSSSGTGQGTEETLGGITGESATAIDPIIDPNRRHTLWFLIRKHASKGIVAFGVDENLVSVRRGLDTATSLGANPPLQVELYPLTGETIRLWPRVNVIGDNGTGSIAGWKAMLGTVKPPANLNTTRYFPARFSPTPANFDTADQEMLPIRGRITSGAPTLTMANINTAGGVRPMAYAGLLTGSTGEAYQWVADVNATVEARPDGKRCAFTRLLYLPGGAGAVLALRSGDESSAVLAAVNLQAQSATTGCIVREGSTLGSGRILFTLPVGAVIAGQFAWDPATGKTRFQTVNQSHPYSLEDNGGGNKVGGVRLYKGATLGALVKTGAVGTLTCDLTLGSGNASAGAEFAGFCAGPGMGVAFSDSFMAAYTANRNSVTDPAGRMAIIRSNVGVHVNHGAETQQFANGYRPSKPGDSRIPDVVVMIAGGRSGFAIETALEDFAELKDWICIDAVIPTYQYNSLNGITAATADAVLAAYTTALGTLIGNLLWDTSNRVFWWGPIIGVDTASNYQLPGADKVAGATVPAVLAYVHTATGGQTGGGLHVVEPLGHSVECFNGNAEGTKIHVSGDTNGARYYAGLGFGGQFNGITSIMTKARSDGKKFVLDPLIPAA